MGRRDEGSEVTHDTAHHLGTGQLPGPLWLSDGPEPGTAALRPRPGSRARDARPDRGRLDHHRGCHQAASRRALGCARSQAYDASGVSVLRCTTVPLPLRLLRQRSAGPPLPAWLCHGDLRPGSLSVCGRPLRAGAWREAWLVRRRRRPGLDGGTPPQWPHSLLHRQLYDFTSPAIRRST